MSYSRCLSSILVDQSTEINFYLTLTHLQSIGDSVHLYVSEGTLTTGDTIRSVQETFFDMPTYGLLS